MEDKFLIAILVLGLHYFLNLIDWFDYWLYYKFTGKDFEKRFNNK